MTFGVGQESSAKNRQAGIGIAMLTLIEKTVSVTIRQSDSEPIASAAATVSISRVEATRVARLSKPAARGDRVMVGFIHSVFERSMPSDLIRGWRPVRVKKTRQNKKPRGGRISRNAGLIRRRSWQFYGG